jgi:hypothetical protein
MKLRRKATAIMLSATMFFCIEARQTSAQEAPPDLRMLMNLDLFEARPRKAESAPAPGAATTDDSMLDQIRTLDAMGYLGRHPDADENEPPRALVGKPGTAGSESVPSVATPEPSGNSTFSSDTPRPSDGEAEPSGNPTFDMEGPQR